MAKTFPIKFRHLPSTIPSRYNDQQSSSTALRAVAPTSYAPIVFKLRSYYCGKLYSLWHTDPNANVLTRYTQVEINERAMTEICKIETEHADKRYSILISVRKPENDVVSIHVNICDKKFTAFRVPMTESSISVPLSIQLTSFESCILGCVVGAVIGDVCECRRGSKNADDFIDCLECKGYNLMDSVTTCLDGCLAAT